MGQKNRRHLQRYESENVALSAHTEQEAEVLVRELEAACSSRSSADGDACPSRQFRRTESSVSRTA